MASEKREDRGSEGREDRSVRLRGYMRTGAAELTKRFEAYRAPAANTEVKLFGADGSWGLSPCESRTSPGKRKKRFSANRR